MTWWEGVVLGVVQGITEFLPVSSSGHLVLVGEILDVETPGVLVEVVLHVATLLAVVVVYRVRMGLLIQGVLRKDRDAWRYLGLLLLASVPAAIVGLMFEDFFEKAFDSLISVGIDFLVTGGILWSTGRALERSRLDLPSGKGAFGIGVAQALAIMPGISRSGATISAALWLRIKPVQAAEFSFLMVLPAISGAALLQISKIDQAGAIGVLPLGLSFGAALFSAVLAIRLLIAVLERKSFHRFAAYCWIIGLFTLGWALLTP